MSHEWRSLPDTAASVFQTVCVRVRTAEIVRQRGVVNAYAITRIPNHSPAGRPDVAPPASSRSVASGASAANRRSTFSVIRDTVLS